MPQIYDQNTVSLKVNGKIYRYWQGVNIEISVNSLVRACAVKAVSSLTGIDLCGDINCGDEVVVGIGDDVVLTGYVVAKDLQYSDKEIAATITVKSKTVDLVECTFPPKSQHSWENASVKDIVVAMCENYSIGVLAKANAGRKTSHDSSVHETIGGELVKFLKKENLLAMDDEYGRLVICQAGDNGQAADMLQTGVNVLSGQRKHDVSNVFREYVTIGQGTNARSEKTSPANSLKAFSRNDSFPRNRVKVWQHKGDQTQSKLQKSADNLRNYTIAKSDVLTYKVQGWRQSTGELWRANMFVTVHDPYFFGDTEQALVISKITYSIDAQGTISTIEAVAPDAFLYTQEEGKNEQKTKAGGKKALAANHGTTFLAKRGSGKITA